MQITIILTVLLAVVNSQRGKEVNTMTYNKPEIELLGDAALTIQETEANSKHPTGEFFSGEIANWMIND